MTERLSGRTAIVTGSSTGIGHESIDQSLLEALRDTVNVIELEYKHY